jgi:hypothetical protein
LQAASNQIPDSLRLELEPGCILLLSSIGHVLLFLKLQFHERCLHFFFLKEKESTDGHLDKWCTYVLEWVDFGTRTFKD